MSGGTRTFFRSRWIDVPDNVTELGGGLPKGFRAAGVTAGIKESGAPDVGLLVSSAPATTSAAARLARSRATPVATTSSTATRTRAWGSPPASWPCAW